jgi:hypothetical protein
MLWRRRESNMGEAEALGSGGASWGAVSGEESGVCGEEGEGPIAQEDGRESRPDVAGLSLLRDKSAYVAIKKSGGALKVAMVSGLTMNTSNWDTTSTGTEAASSAISGTTVWLRANMDGRPGATRQGKFSYSTDGTTFTPIGAGYSLNNDWPFYPGYRFGVFNFATTALGGAVVLRSFELSQP